jgi:hypothetical protein
VNPLAKTWIRLETAVVVAGVVVEVVSVGIVVLNDNTPCADFCKISGEVTCSISLANFFRGDKDISECTC